MWAPDDLESVGSSLSSLLGDDEDSSGPEDESGSTYSSGADDYGPLQQGYNQEGEWAGRGGTPSQLPLLDGSVPRYGGHGDAHNSVCWGGAAAADAQLQVPQRQQLSTLDFAVASGPPHLAPSAEQLNTLGAAMVSGPPQGEAVVAAPQPRHFAMDAFGDSAYYEGAWESWSDLTDSDVTAVTGSDGSAGPGSEESGGSYGYGSYGYEPAAPPDIWTQLPAAEPYDVSNVSADDEIFSSPQESSLWNPTQPDGEECRSEFSEANSHSDTWSSTGSDGDDSNPGIKIESESGGGSSRSPDSASTCRSSSNKDLVAEKRMDAELCWRAIELILHGDDHGKYQPRPAILKSDTGLFIESPKVPRRGKGPKDTWQNSGGLKGATFWPSVEGARVCRRYGKITRAQVADGVNSNRSKRIAYYEYTLIQGPTVSAQQALRHVFIVGTPFGHIGSRQRETQRAAPAATIEVATETQTEAAAAAAAAADEEGRGDDDDDSDDLG